VKTARYQLFLLFFFKIFVEKPEIPLIWRFKANFSRDGGKKIIKTAIFGYISVF